jgi:hypothetical protein
LEFHRLPRAIIATTDCGSGGLVEAGVDDAQLVPGLGGVIALPMPAAGLLVGVGPDHTSLDQRLQAGAQEAGSDAQGGSDLTEAVLAGEDFTQNQERPALPEDFQAPFDGAGRLVRRVRILAVGRHG